MTHWFLPRIRPGQSGLTAAMFANLDRGIPVRRIQYRPVMTNFGFKNRFPIEPEKADTAKGGRGT